uniref:Uncharacterized protein n=1 Tax=Panagrolaimus sp. ES5 TaxID=591445 RepID=A0AC34G4N1_9BILA
MMDLYEFDETEIILPKHNYLKFNCYFKKHENDVIEVHIVNPYNLKINGNKGDFKFETTDEKDIDLSLSFIFDPSTVMNENEQFEAVKSRPESAMRELVKINV